MKVNSTPQTGDFDSERFNKALHLSAQDFIEAEEGVDPETNTLTKEFFLTPVVNVLAVQASPEAAIAESENEDVKFLQGFNITQVQINAGATPTDVFVDGSAKGTATLIPSQLPKVVRTSTGDIDVEKTIEAIDEKTNLISSKDKNQFLANANYSGSLTTDVRVADYTLGEGGKVRAFTFPTRNNVTYANANAYPNAKVTIGRIDGENLKYAVGSFSIRYNATNTINNEGFAAKLKTALTDADDRTYLGKIIRGVADAATDNEYTWQPLNLTAILAADNFTPQTTITSVAQWNDVVKVLDAMVELRGAEYYKEHPVTLTWNGADTEVFKGKIATPQDINITLKTGSNRKMIIAAGENGEEVDWPTNLLTNNSANIEVAEGATLNVGSMDADDLQADKVVINANIDNNGTIHAGVNASIGVDGEGVVDNTLNYDKESEVTNRIIVEYGAYVYPASTTDADGIIAYTVTSNDKKEIGKINLLLNNGDVNDHLASVNTLVIEGTTLDLNAPASYDNGNPYIDGSGAKTLSAKIKDVAIELNGGKIEKVLEVKPDDTPNTAVASITAVGGDNTTTEVKTTTITVKAGKLTIESTAEKDEDKWLKEVETITNYGTITFNTNGEVKDVYNYKQINVNAPYTVTYSSLGQQNPAGGTGNFSGNLKPATPENPAETTEAKAVIAAWEVYKEAANLTTYTGLLEHNNKNASSSGTKAKNFLDALNAWLTANGYDEVTAGLLTKIHLLAFENGAKFSLGLK